MNKFLLLFGFQNQDLRITTNPAIFKTPNFLIFLIVFQPSIIKMTIQQKIINFVALSLFIYSLYYLNNQLSQQHKTHHSEISLMKAIGNGQEIDQIQIAAIKDIVKEQNRNKTDSMACFFRAFEELVIKKEVNTYKLFTLFNEGLVEYEGITECTHYYSMLLYRSLQESQEARKKFMEVLLQQQKNQIDKKYPHQGKNNQICVYFNSHNSESTIKDQFKQLISQKYENAVIIVEEDASTDNSPMLIKYFMDQASQNIKFTQSKEKKGALKGLKQAINQCSHNSIVLMLQQNQILLGDNIFYIIDRIFSNVNTDLILFSTLTTPYINIETVKDDKSLWTQANLLLAIRKSLLGSITWPENVQEDLERSTLLYQLTQRQSSISIADEALIYREQRKTSNRTAKLQRLSLLWQSK